MSPDKNFKMKSVSKTLLALSPFTDSHQRGAYKRMLIESQLQEEASKRASLKSKDTGRNHSSHGVAAE